MQRLARSPVVNQSKLEQIRSGATIKTQTGVKENKNIIQKKGGKFHVHQKEEKFEESGVRKKKKNYVMYESKLGTERQTNLIKIEEAKLEKPKPKPKPISPKPRQEEKIIQTKKKIEYLDNYQYHETKDIKRPDLNKAIVRHQRLGDIIGGSFEETTYQKTIMTDPGRGPKQYSQQTAKTTLRRGAPYQSRLPSIPSMPRSNTAARTLPAKSREYRREIQKNQYSSNTHLSKPPKTTEIITRTFKLTRTKNTSNSIDKPGKKSDNEFTRVTKTTTTTTRGQNASTGRRRQ
jgi:hypothetical protein